MKNFHILCSKRIAIFDARRKGWLFLSTQSSSGECCSPAGMFMVFVSYGCTSVNYGFFFVCLFVVCFCMCFKFDPSFIPQTC